MSGARRGPNRDPSVELARGLAAFVVAAIHLAFGFARFVDGRFAAMPAAGQAAQAAVAAFFVISGAVMVLSAGPRAPVPMGARVFWIRRAVRVLPPYWIATGIFVAAALWTGVPFDWQAVVRSLGFVPASGSAAMPFVPFLWPGWTLAFELVFYVLFGACLVAGRARAVPLCAAILTGLATAGWLLDPAGYLARLLTAPHLLLFVAGLGMGTAIARGWRVPRRWRAATLVAAPVALALLPQHSDWLVRAGVPGVLALVGIAGGPIPRVLEGPARHMGAASYALYLLHVPFAHVWMKVFQTWIGEPGGSIGYLALGLPLLAVLALVFHHAVERPLGRGLVRLLRAERRS